MVLYKRMISIFTFFIVVFAGMFNMSSETPQPTELNQCKNVIFMIGDGMGFNSIEKTRQEKNIEQFAMDTFPLQGKSETRSASNSVTDSAAGGTALATGVRVDNSSVAVYPSDKDATASYPMSLTELAITQGKLAGVITTDSTSGATPSAFSVHTSDRGNEEDITEQQLTGDLTLVWGKRTASFSEVTATANGFITVTDKASMDALTEGTRSFGQFSSDIWHETAENGMPTICEMTEKAIDLLDDDEDGFFLMVEGAHIDKNSHNNNAEGMDDALIAFDKAVAYALEYAQTHSDTLVVVTADHETGGITKIAGKYIYTKTSHSAADVPVFVYGCDNFMADGNVMENRELSRRVANVMGATTFPVRVKK